MRFGNTGHILAFRSILKSEEIVCVWNVMRYNYYLKDNNKKIILQKQKRKKQKKIEEKEEREEK